MMYAIQNCMTEWSYSSHKSYKNPFNDVELDVVITDSEGEEKIVPAFWTGENVWRVRYASKKVGIHQYRTLCSDTANSSLHGQEGVLEVKPYEGDNPLLKHGPLRVSENHRYFEHRDGTPFFWLGDTWWMGLCKRLQWPGDFQLLTADRVNKGFTVIQIVAGLYPDMPPFDPRGANEAGFPWEENYSRINPNYFDMADLRINWLVQSGLIPCIVGCWGYFIDFAGAEVMKKHWRYLLARYGAFPVVWCMAGEATMLYYLSEARGNQTKLQEAIAKARADWTEVTRYLRSIDPYHHPITLHPSNSARDMVDDPSLIDFDMLQTGHGGQDSMPNTVSRVLDSIAQTPTMPVLNGEVCYEGILGQSWQNIQRFAFWACVLSGAAGHTYGANGIWQVNTREKPFGSSPHGMSWGETPWDEAYQLAGSAQMGVGKRLLERYRWWEFEQHPEWAEPHATPENYRLTYAAGIPRSVRFFYLPTHSALSFVKEIEKDISYRAFYIDPGNGNEVALGKVIPDEKGEWQPPKPPIFSDWVLVMENN